MNPLFEETLRRFTGSGITDINADKGDIALSYVNGGRMCKKILILSTGILIGLSIISAVVISMLNSDEYNIKRIQKEFNKKYNTSFEYVNKSIGMKTKRTIYHFRWKADEAVTINVGTGWANGAMPYFYPFDYSWYEIDNFTAAVKEYILNKKYDGIIDITNRTPDKARELITDIMKDTENELQLYHNTKLHNTDITITVIDGEIQKRIKFTTADEANINAGLDAVYKDVDNLERIRIELKQRYSTSFLYSGVSIEETSGKPIYHFVWSENNLVNINTSIGVSTNFLTFIPYIDVKDNFPEALKEYIINSTCKGKIDISETGITAAGEIIYDMMNDYRNQMTLYQKAKEVSNTSITLVIISDGISQEVTFEAFDISLIIKQLNGIN